MRFDAYSATVYASPSLLNDRLPKVIPGLIYSGTVRPQNNYKSATGFDLEEGSIRLSWGGSNPHPFIDAQGPESAILADVLRGEGWEHSCSRVDVAADFTGGREVFDEVAEQLTAFARRNEISTRLISSPSDPDKGRTLYIGSTKSETSVRFYEKGKEQAEKGLEVTDPDALRYEQQTRPGSKARKQQAARMTPEQIFGFSRWSAETARLVLGIAPEVVQRYGERQRPYRRAMSHMAKQYANVFKECFEREGEDALVSFFAELVEAARR